MILLSGSKVSASALMMSPASQRRRDGRVDGVRHKSKCSTGHGAHTNLELADAGRVLARRALEEASGFGDHPLVVEGLGERLRARGGGARLPWIIDAGAAPRAPSGSSSWRAVGACGRAFVGVGSLRRRARGCDASLLRWRARVRFAALVVPRGDGVWMNARRRAFATLRLSSHRDSNGPSSFAVLEVDYREQPKAVVADLSGVVQTYFLRMEECSQRR